MDFVLNGDHCPACNSERLVTHHLHAKRKYPISVCGCIDCGLAWQWPPARDAAESVEYFETAYSDGEEGTYFDPDKRLAVCREELVFVETIVNGGKLIDVGSGDGTFARYAAANGWTAFGVDPAGPEEISINGSGRLCLVRGTLDDLDPCVRGDVVTLWDVIEHVERPAEVIAACKAKLAPGGWLMVETGNFQSASRIKAGDDWWGYDPDHRWYFTPDALRDLLEDAGFRSFRMAPKTLRPWITSSASRAPSRLRYALSAAKHPGRARKIACEFRWLDRLHRDHPETAGLEIFTVAARV